MESDNPSTSDVPIPTTSMCQFRKVKRKGQFRGRCLDAPKPVESGDKSDSDDSESRKTDDEEGGVSSSVVVPAKRSKRKNPMIQSTQSKSIRRTAAADSGNSSEEEIGGAIHQFGSAGVNVEGSTDLGATRTNEIETEFDKDSQAIYSRNLEIDRQQKGKEDDKVYRGMNAYSKFKDVKDGAAANAAHGLVRKGPIRAPTNVRSTVLFDYKPDICKDYKETGFCTFGDSCVFMHDRTDYKHGWELEREWNEGTYGKKDETNYEIHSDSDDEFASKCYICRETFTNPVVTKCGHHFCEKCALAQYKKSARCYECGVQTGGVFNPAKALIAHMKQAEIANEDVCHSHDEDSD